MIIVLAVIAVLAVAAIAVLLRAKKYGGFRAAFSGALKEERAIVTAGRTKVTQLRKAREAELKEVRKVHAQATAAYNDRLVRAQAQVQFLQEPGPGQRIGSLKGVTLYERYVEISGQYIPLPGGRASVNVSADAAMLVFTQADGRTAHRVFDTMWRDAGRPTVEEGSSLVTVTQERKREFSPEQIQALANGINNAVITAERFYTELPEMRVVAAAELELAAADTGAVEATGAQLQAVEAGSQALYELQSAEVELQALEARWAHVSGRAVPQPLAA